MLHATTSIEPMAQSTSNQSFADGWCAFPGDNIVPIGGEHAHDPTVLRIGGKYFCFHTGHDGFRVLRSSTDLSSWTLHEPIMTDRPAWLQERIPAHRSIWAPDVIQIAPRHLRTYYGASERFGWNTSYIGLAECDDFDPDDPTRGWRDVGMLLKSERGEDDFNAIDPEVIVDRDDQHWMFFGSYFSGLHLVALDRVTGKLANPEKPDLIPIARNATDRENAIEGAAAMFRDGWYYLFASYGLAAQGVRSNYRIVVGRSRDVTGPYVDRSGRPMLDGGHTVVLSSSPPMFGPGHCDVFQDTPGRWIMSYHFYDARRFWRGDKWGLPTLQVRDLIWSEDGWPLPGLPVHGVRRSPDRTAPPNVGVRWIEQIDFCEPHIVELDEDRVARQFAYEGSYYVGRDEDDKVIRGAKLAAI